MSLICVHSLAGVQEWCHGILVQLDGWAGVFPANITRTPLRWPYPWGCRFLGSTDSCEPAMALNLNVHALCCFKVIGNFGTLITDLRWLLWTVESIHPKLYWFFAPWLHCVLNLQLLSRWQLLNVVHVDKANTWGHHPAALSDCEVGATQGVVDYVHFETVIFLIYSICS